MADKQYQKRRELRKKARTRNQWRLCHNWESLLLEYEGPGKVDIMYNWVGPSPETLGNKVTRLSIQDSEGRKFGFTLYDDKTIRFNGGPDSCYDDDVVPPRDSPKRKPMILPDGPPPVVTEIIELLGVDPRWENACNDGAHKFELADSTHRDPIQCVECSHSTRTLGFLGHSIPEHRAHD